MLVILGGAPRGGSPADVVVREGAGLPRGGASACDEGAVEAGYWLVLEVLVMVFAVLGGGRVELVEGACRLVDKLTINFPCTTRLSVDFLRSRVNISCV